MMQSKDMSFTYKKMAAEHAVRFVQSGMVVGLGHGSTAIIAVRKIAELLSAGELTKLIGIPCSSAIGKEAKRLGIPVSSLSEHSRVDLTIDGADEVDPDLNLIKGGGGALLKEKEVAKASKREIIIVDESKLSPQLGTKWALPVEVRLEGWESAAEYARTIGAKVSLRKGENEDIFLTDSKNYILDCNFGPINNLEELATLLNRGKGIVEHGLFLGLATDVIVAGKKGIQHLKADRSDVKG